MAFEFAEDCIHLKACRRARKLALKKGIAGGHLTLNCNSETCTAYMSGEEGSYVSTYTAVREARSAFDLIRRGYGDDSLIESDLPGMSLQEIIDEIKEVEG